MDKNIVIIKELSKGRNKWEGIDMIKPYQEKESEYYSLIKVAELSGASYGPVKRDIDHGRLSAYRIGRKYMGLTFVRDSRGSSYGGPNRNVSHGAWDTGDSFRYPDSIDSLVFEFKNYRKSESGLFGANISCYFNPA